MIIARLRLSRLTCRTKRFRLLSNSILSSSKSGLSSMTPARTLCWNKPGMNYRGPRPAVSNEVIPQNQILTDSHVSSHTLSHLFPDSECILLSHPCFRTVPPYSRNIRLSINFLPTISLS